MLDLLIIGTGAGLMFFSDYDSNPHMAGKIILIIWVGAFIGNLLLGVDVYA